MRKKYQYTFKSGLTLTYSPVPSALALEVLRERERNGSRPKAPVQSVKRLGVETTEENPSDPVYIAEMNQWEQDSLTAMHNAVIKRGVVDWDKDEVAEYKSDMEAIGQPVPDLDERILYVKYIAATGGFSEVEHLVNCINSLTNPTEAAIVEAMSTFPGEVQPQARAGEGYREGADAGREHQLLPAV